MGKVRALLIIAAVVLGVFVVGAILVAILGREGTRTLRLQGEVRKVELLSERGAATLRAGSASGAEITAHDRWIVVRPEVDASIEDGTLRVKVSCPSLSLVSCSSDIVVTVPPTAQLDVKTVRGRMEVDGLDGPMRVLSEDGDVAVRGGPPTLDARSVTGTVTADLGARPDRVLLRSETRDVRLTVPSGTYKLTADSTLGGETVTGITSDPAAPRELIASSGKGEVFVTGTP
ncbi:MAG: hypothetical protein U0237_12445 [Thermoleophilia bacterium]